MILFNSKEVIQQGFTEVLVTLCDKELVGKTLSTGLVVSENFYDGKIIEDTSLVLKQIKISSMINALGNKSIDFLMNNNFISKENVVFLGEEKIPHALIFSRSVL